MVEFEPKYCMWPKKKKKNYSRINTLKINKITHTNTVTQAI